MKALIICIRGLMIIIFAALIACNKQTDYSQYDVKLVGGPDGPIKLGCIRGYFGKYYREFTSTLEFTNPVDTFSNMYLYGNCNGRIDQINMLRNDSVYAAAIYIIGYPLDSLPSEKPVPEEFGKFAELQFYKLWDWDEDTLGNYKTYVMNNFYGERLFITDRTDDVLTGTFDGFMNSPVYGVLRVTQGEFKIKVFRKDA